MTFSIVARCPRSGQFGVAAVTAVPAVGKLVTHAAAGHGAVATQARVNPYLGIDGIALLQEGLPAQTVVARLCERDPEIARRQFAVVDAAGGVAHWTGPFCLDWAGARAGDGYCVLGNRLVGPAVLEAISDTMNKHGDTALSERLVAALVAGAETGGDLAGERSATLYIVEHERYPLWDIRVDEHDDPVHELQRLHASFAAEVIPEIRKMPTRDRPGGQVGEDCV